MISLEAINQQVNQQVVYQRVDNWSVNFRVGDCKTYSVDKLARAIEVGYDPKDFKVWLVKDELGQGHAVLVYKDRDVLDNRFSWIEPIGVLKSYGYKFLGVKP